MLSTFKSIPKLNFIYDDVDPAAEYHHNNTFLKAKTIVDNTNQIIISNKVID